MVTKSISELVEQTTVKMDSLYDHFIVRLSQNDIDNERLRVEKEKQTVKDNPDNQNKMKIKQSEESTFRINNNVDHPVHTVYSVGHKCELVKPGDKVLIRLNSRPEEMKFGSFVYLSYSEKSISGILKEEV